MKTVPNFALYGAEAPPPWFNSFYFERIAERAGAYNWEIAPHLHDVLVQIPYVCSGSGEVLIDDAKWAIEPPCLIVCLIVIPARVQARARSTARFGLLLAQRQADRRFSRLCR